MFERICFYSAVIAIAAIISIVSPAAAGSFAACACAARQFS